MFPALIILALFGAFGMIFGLYLFVAWMTLPEDYEEDDYGYGE